MLFKIRTRDREGVYKDTVEGWKLFAGEGLIETGEGGGFAEVYCKSVCRDLSGQEVYGIWRALGKGEEVDGFNLEEDRSILNRRGF